jgi:hypothetical protein
MRVKTPDGKVLAEGKMSVNSEFTFAEPAGEFAVVFAAGEGHQINVPGKEIVK